MKRKIITAVLFGFIISILIVCIVFVIKNKTTVSDISEDTGAALFHLKENIGAVNGQWIIPGLSKAVTRTNNGLFVTTCSSMTPQGITFSANGKYLFISAYCNCGEEHRSVIYVIDSNSHKYLTTLILDTSCHAGGIACSEKYIWVCDSSDKCLRSYKYSSAENAVGYNYRSIYTESSCSVVATPSFMCYANGYLYEGTFSEKSTICKIYYYAVNENSLNQKGCFVLSGISNVQGISINGNHLLVTSSYGRTNKSLAYVFEDSLNKFAKDGQIYEISSAKTYELPNMVEGCYIGSSYTYFLFESGAKAYRASSQTMPFDKYIRLENSLLEIEQFNK